MRNIGIMQGRLLPRYKGRYQSHPVNFWQAEFFIARDLGFDQIEFILDYNDYEQNPLMSLDGIEEIKLLIAETGVNVKSICADYFMEAPFHSSNQLKSEEILSILITNAKELGVIDIVIPCVDHSSLKTAQDFDMFVDSINRILPLAEDANIFINFETDLNPKSFLSLLTSFNSKNIKVNYDSGNSASLGYDVEEEFNTYGHYISDLHIKDRVLNGGSVLLGSGNTKFDKLFTKLNEINFDGIITMQASRDDDYVQDLQRIKKQKEFLETYINKYLK
jgi:sugar phosphate isomerase/epimerase